MKRPVRSQFAMIIPALCLTSALPVPCGAEQMPAWGWKQEEVFHYRQQQKPEQAGTKNPWSPAVVTVPAETAGKGSKEGKDAQAEHAAETAGAVKTYCQNIEDAALDARFLNQKAEILRLEEGLSKRTAALEAKRAEYQEWLKRRDEFISKAEGSLVELYAKIKPDAAALQLAAIDEEAAAALLLKLSTRSSSAILNQMESGKAARLVSVMTGAAKPPEKAPAAENAAAPQRASTAEASPAHEAGKEAAEQQQTAEKKL